MSMDKLFKSDEKIFISPPISLRIFREEAIATESRFHRFFDFEVGSGTQRTTFSDFLKNRDYSSEKGEKELKRTFAPAGKKCEKDILLTVHLMAPMNKPPGPFDMIKLKQRCEVKLIVCGNMPLRKLKDKIFCASDFWCNLEDYQSATDKNAYFSKKFPSGFIFVHDTFYVDRGENTTDISEYI